MNSSISKYVKGFAICLLGMIPAEITNAISGSLIVSAVVFVGVVVALVLLSRSHGKRRGRHTQSSGFGGTLSDSGLPGWYIGGHYPTDTPGEGGEYRRGAIRGSADPTKSRSEE